MRILAAATTLPRNTAPKHKFVGGRRKTSRLTHTIMKRELLESSFNGIGSAASSSKVVEECHNSYREALPPKELEFAKS